MNIRDGLSALMTERGTVAARLIAIDAELDEIRAMFGIVDAPPLREVAPPVADAVPLRAQSIPPFDAERACERCRKSFPPKPGSSGRFCSQECYAVPPDRRREIILRELAKGPTGASDLAKLPEMHGISANSVQNDLQKLRKEGLVRSSEDGWRLTSTARVEPSPARATPSDADLEVAWTPRKDAPSLIGDRPSKPAGYGR